MKNRITGRSAFLALLKDEGITHLFGNPGTTELPIMHALKDHPDLTYVMAMQESLVVAIADGYSRASGKLVACNELARGAAVTVGDRHHQAFLHRHHVGEVRMVLQGVHDRQFGGAGIAEQMRDALVLQQREEGRTPGNAIFHISSCPRLVDLRIK